MPTRFTERMHVQYTTNGTKVCTYKEHRFYCITYQTTNGQHNAMAYHKRDEAVHVLARIVEANGGVTSNAQA